MQFKKIQKHNQANAFLKNLFNGIIYLLLMKVTASKVEHEVNKGTREESKAENGNQVRRE